MRKAQIIFSSFLSSLVLTVISYFRDFRYVDGVAASPSILRLLGTFLICFAVFLIVYFVVELIAKRRKK